MLKKLLSPLAALFVMTMCIAREPSNKLQYQSAFMRVELAQDQPALVELALDSLGKRKLNVNPLWPPDKAQKTYQWRRVGSSYEYRAAGAPAGSPPAWTFAFSPREMRLRSAYSQDNPPSPLVLTFDLELNHATLLGRMKDDGSIRLPALLHLPDLGTFRITSSASAGVALGYAARRSQGNHRTSGTDYSKVTFPAASTSMPQIDYTLEVVDIYPKVPGVEHDPKFDGFRRDWLNIFQLSPHYRVLANHSASDPCAFTLFVYSSIAMHTPPLAPGLTALDLVRETLDRYLSGQKTYGMVGYSSQVRYNFLDVYPSLLMAAGDYVRGSNDLAWLEKNYAGVKEWGAKMLAMDVEGIGLLEYPLSGNYGSWTPKVVTVRPANWWDTVGFGHLDAYSNTLAYQAMLDMAEMAKKVNHPDDAQFYTERAEKLHSVYFKTFYNPETGVIASWKSSDGQMHDYYFPCITGMAITYGLVPADKANDVMDHLLAKMKEVGYTHFEFGIPATLIPIHRGDDVSPYPRFGASQKEDGSDGFQVYQNGGAAAYYEYYVLNTLYKLGRRKEADAMLFPLLAAYERGDFQGRGANGLTNDIKAWDGTPHGYEGFLTDQYQALLSVLSR